MYLINTCSLCIKIKQFNIIIKEIIYNSISLSRSLFMRWTETPQSPQEISEI